MVFDQKTPSTSLSVNVRQLMTKVETLKDNDYKRSVEKSAVKLRGCCGDLVEEEYVEEESDVSQEGQKRPVGNMKSIRELTKSLFYELQLHN